MPRVTAETVANVEVAGQVPPQMTGTYSLRIINTDNKPSKSSGNPMATVECEIASPEKIKRSGVDYVVAGLKVKYYFPTRSSKGAKESGIVQKAYYEFRKLIGVADPTFDSDNPEHEDLRGLGFKAILHSEERIPNVLNSETGQYEQMKDEETGQPVSRGWQIKKFNNEILSRAELNS